ncbi:MAG: GEVED domain-containing protein [Fluviicola sp.]|nr:GEVED domain-containing protein [Fluviicola sp.]
MLFSFILVASGLKAQLTGIKTIPADYASIALFVTDVNTQGVGAGGVTLNVPAGYTETSTGVISLTATGTITNPIIIQKFGAGANPVITSYTGGTGTPATVLQDGIFALIGSDYVLIDGIDLTENAANTTNPSTMEYGFGLFKASATDGCQFNAIRNCVVTLNRVNNASGTAPAFDGSRGINVVNSLITTQTTAVTVTAATGSNSNNIFYSNTLQNVNIGIALSGFAAATPFTLADTGNDVGGSSLATANSILNFGGGGTTSPAAGIRTANQWTLNVSFNTVNNNTGAGINHATTLRGILIGAATSANATINNNTVTVVSGATTSLMEGISNASGSTAAANTININNNTVNMAYPTATTGSETGIANTSSASTVNISGNTVTSVLALPLAQNVMAGTGTLIGIAGGSPATLLTVNNNVIQNFARTSIAGGTTRGIVLGTSPTQTASGNTVENIAYATPTSTGSIDGIYSLSSAVIVNITNNIVRNLSTPTTGTITGIRENTVAGTKTITGNQIYGFATTSGGAGGASFNGIFTSVGTVTVQNNTIYNLVSTGTTGGTGGTISGVSTNGGTTTSILANKIYDLASNSTNPVVSGVLVSGGTTINVHNNLIGDLRTPFANAANPLIGINVTGGTTSNIAYNTVHLIGSSAGALFGSSAISVSTTPTVNLNNNIFSNTSSANGAGLAVAYRRSTTTLTSYGATSNRNDFVASTIYTDGTTPQATLVAYQALVATRDANSISQAPNFLSTTGANSTFLHINVTISTLLESGGAVYAGVTTDFDNDIRQGAGGYAGTGTAPDIGADEFELALVNCAAASGGTISPATNTVCAGTTRLITSVGATNLNGNTYQWKVSLTPGGPYSNVVGGTGATTTAYTTGVLTPGTYYYVLETSCSFGSLTGLSNEYTLVVNALPVVSVTPPSATYCIGGTAVALTASGAFTYAWSPAAGLSAATGANVNATPASTTTYAVVGVDAIGCTSLPTNVVVTATSIPAIASVTATPSSVCSGGSSQLQAASATSPVNEYAFSAGTGTTLDPMTGATTLITTSNDDTPNAAPVGIGFTFPYNGSSYTQFSVSPDGWLLLGGATAVADFSNQVTDATNIPKIFPYWDDVATGTTGNVTYVVTGTAPNRILVVQWFVTVPRNLTGAANSTFQAWLYESNGKIEFRYGTMGASAMSSSVGLTGSVTNFNSVTIASNTNSIATPNDLNAGQPVLGTIYTFTPPTYTYAWTPGTFLNSTTIANPLASGITATTTYNVTATNGGCTSAPSPVTITSGSALTSSASITPSNTVCAGTAITISATGIGGGAPYTYAWTGPNGFTSTSASNPIASAAATDAGLYSVTVTDNCGATSVSTVTLTVNALPVVSATPATSLYCSPGTGVTLTASGATTYAWSPASGLSATTGASVTATPSSNTTYTVIGTDGNGCTASATAIVNSALAITSVTATATPTSTCTGNSVLTASATLPSSSYCQPTYSNGTGFGDYVSLVQLNTLNNATAGSGSPYYTLYPTAGSTTTTLTAGSTYTITLSPGTYTQNDLAAWIDFNQNGTLNDASEKLGETNNVGAAPATTAFTFTVPLTANNGVTRLRVRDMDYGLTNAMDPCGAQSTFGETEDYNITIVGGVDPYTITWSPATYLSSTSGPSVSASGIAANITYTATATTAAGCTNSNTASVTLLAPTSSSSTVTACGSYTWAQNSTTYTTSGAYTAVIPNAAGCDSTITLNLTINQPTSSTVTVAACGSYTWAENTTTYTVSGSYPVVLAGANAAGCDSTVTLNLTINQPTSSSVTVAACGSYTWAENTTTYTASGSYPVVLAGANANGCDSTITLNLTINQPTSSSVTEVACGSYTWAENGTTYTASGSYPVVLAGANANGCDSTITLNLTINQPTSSSVTEVACGSYTWAENGTTYTASGSYPVVLAGANANGCDSTVTLVLTITGLPTATATDNGDATITASAGASYQWIDCATNTAIAGATSQTYTATVNGDYAVVVTNAGGCSDTSSCVTIDYIGLTEITDASIQVFPNPTNSDVTITMTATEASVEVVDAQGKILQAVTVGNGEKVNLSTYETGVYFLRIRTVNGSTLERVVKQQ